MQKILGPILVLALLIGMFFLVFPASHPVGPKPLSSQSGTVKPTSTATPADISSALKIASENIDRGNFDAAIPLLEPLKSTDNAEVLSLLGYAYSGRKDFFDAISAFEASVSKKHDPRILYALAVAADAAGEAAKAKAHYTELSRLQIPPAIMTKSQLGLARNSLLVNDIPAAIEAYKRVIKEDPTQVEAFVGLIKLMKQTGVIKGIEKIREKGDPLHSRNFDYQFWLGFLYYEMGQDQPAMIAFKAASAIKPDNASPYYFQYRILRKANKVAESLIALEAYYKISQFLPYIFFQGAIDARQENHLDIAFKFIRTAILADRSLLGGEDQGTLAAVERFVTTQGTPEEKLFNTSFSLFLNGDFRGALNKAREILPKLKDPILKADLFRVQDECGKVVSGEEAYSAYQANINATQKNAMSRLKSAMTARKNLGAGNPSAALDDLKTKALGNPRDAKLQYATALQLARAGDIEGAKVFLRETIRANPNVSEAYFSLARLSQSEGNAAETIAHLEQALKVNPGNSQARSLLASVRLDSGDLERAVSDAKGAILANPNNCEARLVLANVYVQNQNQEQALHEIEYGLSIETDPVRRQQFEALKRKLEAHEN
ncbi:MAG: tetratricopeptide repeat protein [Candidatus Riflebacteria bacterium]|nr:tetratricopeptide repeat protein [Candidatus Riflebacteria bacterium]